MKGLIIFGSVFLFVFCAIIYLTIQGGKVLREINEKIKRK